MEMALVNAATKSDRKKRTAKKEPKGIWLNTAGIVAKVRPGPASGDKPNAKTAGMIMRPPKTEAMTAKTTIQSVAGPMLTSLLK